MSGVVQVEIDEATRTVFQKRLPAAEQFLSRIVDGFRNTIQLLAGEDSSAANTSLALSVDHLMDYINLYLSLLAMDAEHLAPFLQRFGTQVDHIQQLCEQLVEPQMYQSHWRIADLLEREMLPRLHELQELCRETASAVLGGES